MEYLILHFDNRFGEFQRYDTNSPKLATLGTAFSCETEDWPDDMLRILYKQKCNGSGGNVTIVDVIDDTIKVWLSPSVFGEDDTPFITDKIQFKYMLERIIQLRAQRSRAILITRDTEGKITVEEAPASA